MKRKDLQQFKNGLDMVSTLQGVKFAYAVSKNKKLVNEELEVLTESVKPTEKFEEYEKARVGLCVEHSEKKEDGQPVIIGQEFKIIDMAKFEVVMAKLNAEYQEVIDSRKSQIEEYESLLEGNIELPLVKVTFYELPEKITSRNIDEIIDMID